MSSDEMPESIQNNFNNFWNIYGKNISSMTKSAKVDLGPGVMIVDVKMIENKLNNKESEENSAESYYATYDSLPDFIKNIKEFTEKIEKSKENNMIYTILLYGMYHTMIGNEIESD